MKKYLFLVSAFVLALTLSVFGTAHAADTLPANAVWFTPATAQPGEDITLNALMYNDQTVDATVTVAFTTPTINIAAVTTTISAGAAKTISFDWKMPKDTTVMTATVTAATDKSKHTLTPLLGTLGTITIGTQPMPLINGITFPGSAQISAWFGPFFSKLEVFRSKEATIFSAQRDAVKAKITSSATEAFHTPINYVVLIYTTCLAAIFSNIAFFYIALILIVLLVLKFIVNLIF